MRCASSATALGLSHASVGLPNDLRPLTLSALPPEQVSSPSPRLPSFSRASPLSADDLVRQLLTDLPSPVEQMVQHWRARHYGLWPSFPFCHRWPAPPGLLADLSDDLSRITAPQCHRRHGPRFRRPRPALGRHVGGQSAGGRPSLRTSGRLSLTPFLSASCPAVCLRQHLRSDRLQRVRRVRPSCVAPLSLAQLLTPDFFSQVLAELRDHLLAVVGHFDGRVRHRRARKRARHLPHHVVCLYVRPSFPSACFSFALLS